MLKIKSTGEYKYTRERLVSLIQLGLVSTYPIPRGNIYINTVNASDFTVNEQIYNIRTIDEDRCGCIYIDCRDVPLDPSDRSRPDGYIRVCNRHMKMTVNVFPLFEFAEVEYGD